MTRYKAKKLLQAKKIEDNFFDIIKELSVDIVMNHLTSDELKKELTAREQILKIREHLFYPVIQKLFAILKHHGKIHYENEEQFILDIFKNPTKYEPPVPAGWFS